RASAGARPTTPGPPRHRAPPGRPTTKRGRGPKTPPGKDTAAAPAATACGLGVTSNEPVNGPGDGDSAPDWIIVNSHFVQLRSERAGGGSGRLYTIGITCQDTKGNASATSVGVTVSHDQGH